MVAKTAPVFVSENKREENDASMMQWYVIIKKTIITGFGGSSYERG